MKKSIKKVFLLLLCIPFLLIGCSSESNSTSDDGKVDGKTQIKITWRDVGEHDKLKKYLTNTFIPEFEKENPDIKIVLSPITASEGIIFLKWLYRCNQKVQHLMWLQKTPLC
ncbi:hypothetical protein AAHH67_11335 [Niallia circulans]